MSVSGIEMVIKRVSFVFFVAVILLGLSGCNWFGKTSGRETIFDRVVSIPKELVLDIPKLPPLCDEIKDLKKGFVDVENGGRIYYEQEGEGKGITLVLINGGPGGTHHVFHPYFSQVKDYANIIYYDQRGTGKSSVDNTGKTYNIKQAVQDLDSLRKELKIEKWAVLGWSYGGFLAQCYALTYPENVTGLILVASADDGLKNVKVKPGRTEMFISQEEREAINKARAAGNEGKITPVQAGYNAHLAGDWKRQSYYKPTMDEFAREALYEWSPAPGFRSLIGGDEDKIALDGKFDDFEIPTLIFEAKWDLTWDTDKAEFIRKNHPKAQFEYFKKSGHGIFADEPEKFFPILKNFLEKYSKMQIVYKPGNKLTWPKPLEELALKVKVARELSDKKEGERIVLACYKQAFEENNQDADVWDSLFHAFFRRRKNYEECLYSLQRYEELLKIQNPEEFKQIGQCIKAWRGMMLDLLGRRDEAIKCYQEVLQNFKGVCNNCGQVDRKWLEDHIKKPFKWDEK